MIRRPPRSTLDRSSAASDVYKRQDRDRVERCGKQKHGEHDEVDPVHLLERFHVTCDPPVSYTHLRAHETVLDLVCRLLLEKKKKEKKNKKNIKKTTTQ